MGTQDGSGALMQGQRRPTDEEYKEWQAPRLIDGLFGHDLECLVALSRHHDGKKADDGRDQGYTHS
jgi:hypothetical protein